MSDSVWPHRRQPMRLPLPWDSPGKNTGVSCNFLLQCMKVKSESAVAQSCLTLSDPMDCGPPGSSIHGIFQARVLEWGAIAFSDNVHVQSQFSDCWKGCLLWRVFSWQNFVNLLPAWFCTPRPNLPVISVSWLPTFTFQSPMMKRLSSFVVKFCKVMFFFKK